MSYTRKIMKNKRAKREAKNVAVSEKSAKDGGIAEEVCVHLQADENKNSGQMNRGKSLTDTDVITAMMQKFSINSTEACTLIMRVAENMRKAA